MKISSEQPTESLNFVFYGERAKCGFLVGVFHEGGRGGIPACW